MQTKECHKRKGIRRGIKRYLCSVCHASFSSKRILANLQEVIFKKYIYKRYILSNLVNLYQHSIP